MPERKTYHLYHHQPDPLPPEELADRAWLINNAVAYSVVAVIAAPGVQEALQAAQCKAEVHPLPRRTAIQAANLLRKTLPGDVLVDESAAWMVDSTNQARPIAAPVSQPWKSLRQRPGQQAAVDTLAWSPDGKMIAASAGDHRVVLHVVANGEPYRNAYERGEGYGVTALVFSPHGKRLAAAHRNGDIHVWKPDPWQQGGVTGSILICRAEERVRTHLTAQCVAWSPNGARLFAGYEDGRLLAWNTHTGDRLFLLLGYHQKALTTLAFAPHNEDRLLSASADHWVRIWNRAAHRDTVYQHTAEVAAAVWSPDGHLVASSERADPTVHLWNSQTGMLLERLPLSIFSTEGVEACSLAFSPDGHLLAAGCNDSTIQLVDLARHQHVHTYRVDGQARRRIVTLAFSPDGSLLAVTDRSTGIDIWQVMQDLEAARETNTEETSC